MEDYSGNLKNIIGLGYNISYGYAIPINKGKSCISPEIGIYYIGTKIDASYSGVYSSSFSNSLITDVKKRSWNIVTMVNFLFYSL